MIVEVSLHEVLESFLVLAMQRLYIRTLFFIFEPYSLYPFFAPYPILFVITKPYLFISKSSSRYLGNGLGAGEGTVWGWRERFEGRGGNGLGDGGWSWRERVEGWEMGMGDGESGLGDGGSGLEGGG